MLLERGGVPVAATVLVAISLLLPIDGRALAQSEAHVALLAGVGTDQHGVRSNTLTFAPSLSFGGTTGGSFALGGRATRFGDESVSFGAAISASGRRTLANWFALTVDAAADGSQLRPRRQPSASFAGAQLLSAGELSVGRLKAFGGARIATGYASSPRAPSLPIPSDEGAETRVRTGAGPTFGLNLDALSSPTAALRLGVREDRLEVAGQRSVDRSLSTVIAGRSVSLSAQLGRRSENDAQSGFHNAALAIRLRDDIGLQLDGGRFPADRLLGTPSGEYVSAGFTFRFRGALAHQPRLPRVQGARAVAPGLTRLSLEASDATRVELAGDFNQWHLLPASRGANGVWYADIRIPPGQYRYAFRVNGKEWRVPRGATVTEDGFGGKSALLSVEGNNKGGR